jgi:sortase A
MSKKSKKIGVLAIVLGVLLIGTAAVLLVGNHIADMKAGEAAQTLLSELKQEIDDTGDAQPPEMATVEIDGYDYIGYLLIPTLQIELPVMSEWDYNRLNIAPCRQFGSAWTNDLVIAGHNYSRHFGLLSSIALGDSVSFVDVNGNVFDYVVADIRKVKPTAVEWVEHSGFDLILYTCTYGGKSRITICCNRSKN